MAEMSGSLVQESFFTMNRQVSQTENPARSFTFPSKAATWGLSKSNKEKRAGEAERLHFMQRAEEAKRLDFIPRERRMREERGRYEESERRGIGKRIRRSADVEDKWMLQIREQDKRRRRWMFSTDSWKETIS